MTIERHLTGNYLAEALRDDARYGLTSTPKTLPPKWFYDARGSDLFERITRLPEYYPTRAERAILRERAAEIAKRSAADTLLELGAGSAEKTRALLDALADAGTLTRYIPVDVSDDALVTTVHRIKREYPGTDVHGVVADFEQHLHLLPARGRRLVAFLGGTIGNMLPAARVSFLSDLRAIMSDGDSLLLGTDLIKDRKRLLAAYDDAAGVTAEFNRNVLRVLNRELGADFTVDAFQHVALWEARHEWIEMRLRSATSQRVRLAALDLNVEFAVGEELRTEVSAKFRRDTVDAELRAAGLVMRDWWTDPDGDFALSLSVPDTAPRHGTAGSAAGSARR